MPFWAPTRAAYTSYDLPGSFVAVYSTGRIRSAANNDDERLVNDLHSLVIPGGLCIALATRPGHGGYNLPARRDVTAAVDTDVAFTPSIIHVRVLRPDRSSDDAFHQPLLAR